MRPPTTVHEICRPQDYRAALAVLHARVDYPWRESVVEDTFERVASGEIDLSGLWVASRRGRIKAVFLTQMLPGRAAAIWPPESSAVLGRASLVEGLVRFALERLAASGARLAQALLDPSETVLRPGQELTAAGVPRVTSLTYLERSTITPLEVREGVPELEWRSFSSETEPEFRRALDLSYEGSLDMPELATVRSLDDIIASQDGASRFEPTRWLVGRVPGESSASAILLLAEIAEKPAWEITYFGLSPAARGRGLGKACLAHAMRVARPFANRLELAVDERNDPADRLYRSAGFTSFDRRAVHLKLLTSEDHSASR